MNMATLFIVILAVIAILIVCSKINNRRRSNDTGLFGNKKKTIVSENGFSVLPMFNMVCKPFSFEEDGIFYNNATMIPYTAISEMELIVTPKDPLECGMMFVHSNGQIFKVGYTFKDRERFIHAYKIAYAKLNKKCDEKYWLLAHTGTYVKVYEDYILLRHMTPGAQVVSGSTSGQKRIPIEEITSVQLKEPAGLTVGFIQFSYAGSTELRGDILQAMHDENAVPVDSTNVPLAREIADYIYAQKKMLKNTPITQVQSVSTADELKKFKELLDIGIITQEEFDAKKKQLLGL